MGFIAASFLECICVNLNYVQIDIANHITTDESRAAHARVARVRNPDKSCTILNIQQQIPVFAARVETIKYETLSLLPLALLVYETAQRDLEGMTRVDRHALIVVFLVTEHVPKKFLLVGHFDKGEIFIDVISHIPYGNVIHCSH